MDYSLFVFHFLLLLFALQNIVYRGFEDFGFSLGAFDVRVLVVELFLQTP